MSRPMESAGDIELRKAEFMPLFPTPVLKYQWPDSEALNAELEKIILSRKDESPGTVKTNRRGWQSDADFQTWPEDSVKLFLHRVELMVQEMVKRTIADPDERHLEGWKIRAWANAFQKGGLNTAHNHDGPCSLWSGFYYVNTGRLQQGESVGGRTKFQDRSGVPKEVLRNRDPYENEVTIVPRSGLMVLFPATLYHYVEPYLGDGRRISIAFNLWHPGFKITYYEGMRPQGWWWENFRGLMVIRNKVPEKVRGLSLVPGKMLERKLPQTFGWLSWKEHIKTAIDHAFAEASLLSQEKRAKSEEGK